MDRILKLTLKKQWFDLMISGEKTSEYRVPGKWIESRLYNKDGSKRGYDLVQFTNGYGEGRPRFCCDFMGFRYIENVDQTFSDGSRVNGGPFYEILLGNVVLIKNE